MARTFECGLCGKRRWKKDLWYREAGTMKKHVNAPSYLLRDRTWMLKIEYEGVNCFCLDCISAMMHRMAKELP